MKLLICIFFIIGCLFLVNSEIINTPGSFSLIDLDTANDPLIIFQTQNVTFDALTLKVKGDCRIESTAPLSIPVEVLQSSATDLNSLTLVNVTLTLNGNTNSSSIFELKLVIDGTSIFNVAGEHRFTYENTLTETTIISGGGSLKVTSGTMAIVSSQKKSFIISTPIYNNKTFGSGNSVTLKLNPNSYFPSANSENAFNGGLIATAKGNLHFLNCIFKSANAVDMAGGKIIFNNTMVYNQNSHLKGVVVEFHNTEVVVDKPSTFNFITNSNDTFGSYSFIGNSSFSLLRGANSILIKIHLINTSVSEPIIPLFFYSESSSITCGTFPNSNNIASYLPYANYFKSYTICNKRTISTRLFRDQFSGPILPPCPDDQYLCVGQTGTFTFECLPLGETCPFDACFNVYGLFARDFEETQSADEELLCWDSSCQTSYDDCAPFPACPVETPLRCSGECLAADQKCEDQCALRCVEKCYNSSEIAGGRTCQPYNGCGLDMYQCPDKECVSDLKLCSNSTQLLPFSSRFLDVNSGLLDGDSNVVMWVRDSEDTKLYANGQVSVKFDQNETTIIKIKPIPDSKATKISGVDIVQDFNYYKDLLIAPFSIQVGSAPSSQFSEPVVFQINIPSAAKFPKESLCLAFENTTTNKWECTPYSVEFDTDGYAIVKTTHFTRFSVLTSYRPAKNDTSEQSSAESVNNSFNSKKNLYLAISLSVIGIVLITVGVGVFIGFKLKYTSLKRWKISRDLERENSRSRLSESQED
ncbi:hypothetical protein DLAC_00929 [Tieghemostelium lacteum]|uniref:Uncharacterized protein n=1 Tax=Tieghemostelium lacteum TaxID=361077 RepID=A0A152A7C8_TIELA|nr:hypothetical protein DLAC_00929 [Tieghemostelium lacteum]|eukprot:KYR02129.1 hypothetical protein DLAC_00929 [Tieghemostelium lacteum]